MYLIYEANQVVGRNRRSLTDSAIKRLLLESFECFLIQSIKKETQLTLKNRLILLTVFFL